MRESNTLKACRDYLQFQQNLGKLMYLRLNSGSLFPVNSKTGKSYRVDLCPVGTTDLVIVRNNPLYFGFPEIIWPETKSTNGKLSKEQEAFREMVIAHGGKHLIVKDADELIKALE